jgi:DnaJ-class molecular chaperone
VFDTKDYHKVLGVSKKASKKQIQEAYRRLAMEFHPDKNRAPDAEDRFKEISEAYAVLSGKEKAPPKVDTRKQQPVTEEQIWAYRVVSTWKDMEEKRFDNMYR